MDGGMIMDRAAATGGEGTETLGGTRHSKENRERTGQEPDHHPSKHIVTRSDSVLHAASQQRSGLVHHSSSVPSLPIS